MQQPDLSSFLPDFRHDDLQIRLNAVRNLGVFAKTSPDNVFNLFHPAIKKLLEDDDELLLSLAAELGALSEHVSKENLFHILDLLEVLAKAEETLVRDKAVEAIIKTVPLIPKTEFKKRLIGLINRLAAEEWFVAKSAACALIPAGYEGSDEAGKLDLANLYKALASDETPMVRRAAATHLKELIPQMSIHLLTTILEPFKLLAKDEQDSVRLLAVEAAIAAAANLSKNNDQEQLAQVKAQLEAMATDKSWRVRYVVATHFAQLTQAVGASIPKDELSQMYVKLLKDSEGEVRSVAAGTLSKVIGQGLELNENILKAIESLVNDEAQNVREPLASDILLLTPYFGEGPTKESFMTMFQSLLKDPVPEVRLNVISKLDKVTDIIGLERLSAHLIPAIVELAGDKHWRVRLAVIEYIPPLARQLTLEYFNQHLNKLCLKWLSDSVFGIREKAASNLKLLVEIFGSDYLTQSILPKISELVKERNYLYRVVSLFMINQLISVTPPNVILENYLPTLDTLVTDPTPNIRLNVGKTFKLLIQDGRIEDLEPVIAHLKTLSLDTDQDVHKCAMLALDAVNKK